MSLPGMGNQEAIRNSMKKNLGANLMAVDAFNNFRSVDNGDGASTKHLAMRWRAKTRACRMLNSKARAIGINLDDLDMMKKSKEAAKYAEKQEGINTAAHWRAINTALSQQEMEDQIQKNEANQRRTRGICFSI